MTHYAKWIGLPHVIGADPDDGVGADCLIVAHRVRSAAGHETPPLNPQWFKMAECGQWARLKLEWLRLMEPCEIEPYAICMYQNPECFGVGIVVDGGVLRISNRRGVQWVPLALERHRQFWKPRAAAI